MIYATSKNNTEKEKEMQGFYQSYKALHGKFKDQDIVTVCTVKNEKGEYGRGVAVCLPEDTPNIDFGYQIAMFHAQHAIKGRSPKPIIKPAAIKMILKTQCPFTMHSEKNPELTFQEMILFNGKKRIDKIVDYIKKR